MNNYDLDENNVDLSQSYIESLMDDDKIKKYVKKKKTEEEENNFVLELITNYIGSNHKNIVNKKFSLPGFLLGPIYLLYRKFYLFGFIYLLALSLISSFFYNVLIVDLVLLLEILIVNLIIGLQFNKRYLDSAFNKVKQIEIRNNNLPDEAILEICKRKGGTSAFASTVLVMIVVIVSLLIVYASKDDDLLNKLNLTNDVKFNGKFVYEQNGDITNVSFMIPRGYISKSNYSGYKEYSNGTCVFSIGKLKTDVKEEDIKTYIENSDYAEYISSMTNNNIKWINFVKGGEMYYKTSFNNNGYVLTFRNYSNATCSSTYTNIVTSLQVN